MHVTDDTDDTKDYTATKVRDMQIALNKFVFVSL